MDFVLGLVDKISGPGKSAADVLSALKKSLQASQAATKIAQGDLAGLEKQMREMQAGASVDVAAFKALKTAIDEKKTAIANLKTETARYSGAVAAARGPAAAEQKELQEKAKALKAAEVAEAKLVAEQAKLTESTSHVSHETAQVTKAVEDAKPPTQSFGDSLAALGPLAAAAAVAIAGVAVVLAKGAAFAVQATQAKQQMIAMFTALGEGKVSGAQMDDMLTKLRGELGQTKDSMVPFVKQALAMGVSSQAAIEGMTKAAVAAKALTGGSEEAGNAFFEMQAKIQTFAQAGQGVKLAARGIGQELASMGLNLDDVSAAMGTSSKALTEGLKNGTVNAAKFGQALTDALNKKGKGAIDTMSAGVKNMAGLFKENIGDMFEDMGPAIAPFLGDMKELINLFSQNTESGKAMKFIVTSVFTGIFDVAHRVFPILKHFMLDLVIAALKIYIAAKPLVAELKKVFGASDGETVTAVLKSIVDGMMYGIIFAIQFYTTMLKVWESIIGAGKAVVGFVASAYQAGSDFVTGLVKGIGDGAGKAVEAVKGLGTQVVNGIKSTLGIKSPSKVMMQMGAHTAEGFAQGVDSGAPRAQGAISAMSAPPASGGGGGPSGGGPISVTINIEGVQGAAELKDELPNLIAMAFEKLALQGGT